MHLLDVFYGWMDSGHQCYCLKNVENAPPYWDYCASCRFFGCRRAICIYCITYKDTEYILMVCSIRCKTYNMSKCMYLSWSFLYRISKRVPLWLCKINFIVYIYLNFCANPRLNMAYNYITLFRILRKIIQNKTNNLDYYSL